VSWLIATPLLTTTSVMVATVVLAALGYRMQYVRADQQDNSLQAESTRV